MAKISIEANNTFLSGDHLYLVYEDDSGNEFVIRGGPVGNDPRTNIIDVEVGATVTVTELIDFS